MEFGQLWQVALGEKGRGRKEIRLACPDGCVVDVDISGFTSAVWVYFPLTILRRPWISQTKWVLISHTS